MIRTPEEKFELDIRRAIATDGANKLCLFGQRLKDYRIETVADYMLMLHALKDLAVKEDTIAALLAAITPKKLKAAVDDKLVRFIRLDDELIAKITTAKKDLSLAKDLVVGNSDMLIKLRPRKITLGPAEVEIIPLKEFQEPTK